MDTTAKTICWRRISAVTAVLVIIGSILWNAPAAVAASGEDVPGASSAPDAYNIVLLIDQSGSMNTTDPHNLARDAANMFVDSFYVESQLRQADGPEQAASEVAVVAFSEYTQTVMSFEEMSTRKSVNDINAKIRSITHQPPNTGATDLGRAVLKGTELLKKSGDSAKRNTIVLFTDGFTEFPYYSDQERQVKETESAHMLRAGIQAAQEMECEIFVVGLNYEGYIKEAGRREIKEIANSTQIGGGLIHPETTSSAEEGLVNYLITSTPLGVQHFYEKLFSYLLHTVEPIPVTGLIENGWTYYDIPVDTPDIFAVNIYITSATETIKRITMRDPDGMFQDLSDLARGNGYALLTIRNPQQGTWRIGAEGEVFYNVAYVPFSSAHLEIEVRASGSHGNLTVQAFSGSGAVDNGYYNTDAVSFTAKVTSETDGSEFPVELTLDESLNAMAGAFIAPRPGVYMVDATMISAHMQCSASQRVEFTAVPVIRPLEIELQQHTETIVDLSGQLPDGWDTALRIDRVECLPEELAEISVSDACVTIRGLQRGEASLTVCISDNFGQSWTIPGTVRIIWNTKYLIPVFIVPALLVMLLALAVWRRTRYVEGQFTVTCISSQGGYCAERGSGPRGTSFTLYKLLKYMNMDPQNEFQGPVVKAVETCRKELSTDRYRIHLVKNRQQTTYRYGKDRHNLSALGEDIFYDDQTGLQVSVTFQPEQSGEDML